MAVRLLLPVLQLAVLLRRTLLPPARRLLAVAALLAGLALGVVEVLTAGYVNSGLKEAVAFLILVVTLWTRPSGLFGQAVLRRA